MGKTMHAEDGTRRRRRWVWTGILLLLFLLVGGGLFFLDVGPFAPETVPASPVEFVWAGAVTTSTARINARIAQDTPQVRLLISERPDLRAARYSAPHVAQTLLNDRVVSIAVDDLLPDTSYYYALEVAGQVDQSKRGQFTTPAEGSFSFTFALASCAQTGSTHPVFNTIRAHQPLFLLHMGDLHYANIEENDASLYQAAFRAVLTAPPQAALYRSTPIVYIWDDHDYGPNNSDATAPGREAARLTYQQYVPHYPLAVGEGNVPLYQAFTVGRTRFIVTDLRSERAPDFTPDDGSKSMLGETQKVWLKQELLAAKDRYKLIVWVSSVPWIAPAEEGEDHWGGFSRERQEIADFIVANGIEAMLMVSGDAHMLAIDDGRNNHFATDGEGPGFPVFQAAALDRFGSTKGGPYSHGTAPGRGQFGLVTVEDHGGESITVTLSGRNSADEVLMAHTFTVSPTLAPVAGSDLRTKPPWIRPGWVLLPLLLLLALLLAYWKRTGPS